MKSVNAGYGHAAKRLADYFSNSKKEAFEWYEKGANMDDDHCLFEMAKCLENGVGVCKDITKAVRIYKVLSYTEGGNLDAKCRLGLCYENGTGVQKNLQKAITLYREGAEERHQKSCYYLGYCYEFGNGVQKDIKRAIELYEDASRFVYSAESELAEKRLKKLQTKLS